MKTWRETDPSTAKGKWEKVHTRRQLVGCTVSQSDAKGGNTSSLRGRGGDSVSTAWRASGEGHRHHGRRAKRQGAQLLDRGLWAPLSTSWRPVQPGVHRPSPESTGGRETTCRKPLEPCNTEQGHGAGSRVPVSQR